MAREKRLVRACTDDSIFRTRFAAPCVVHFSGHCFANRFCHSRWLRSPHEWKSSRRKNGQALVSIRSPLVPPSSFPPPATKQSEREIRNPSGALPRLPLLCPRVSTVADRECIRARRVHVCP